jgi:hypothetical protein
LGHKFISGGFNRCEDTARSPRQVKSSTKH